MAERVLRSLHTSFNVTSQHERQTDWLAALERERIELRPRSQQG